MNTKRKRGGREIGIVQTVDNLAFEVFQSVRNMFLINLLLLKKTKHVRQNTALIILAWHFL